MTENTCTVDRPVAALTALGVAAPSSPPPPPPDEPALDATDPDAKENDPSWRYTVADDAQDERNARFFHPHATCRFLGSNAWPKYGAGAALRRKAARAMMAGVAIRTLDPPHPLAGQQGLFASQV